MQALFRQIEEFAPSNLPVVIRGEAGTGKELVASAVQHLSRRRARGYQPVNCPDFTPDLLRSELFGHERGAFTGAVAKKAGLLPRVDGGTVFLDEIGELAPLAQSMLLRFLQTGEGLAVGATPSMRLDVRVIAATHRDLEAAVVGGTFREDFYYRLWGAVLRVPPLRTRPEDIRRGPACGGRVHAAGAGPSRGRLLAGQRARAGAGRAPGRDRPAPRAGGGGGRGVPRAAAAAGVVSAPLSRHQAEALRMASAGGEVRRGVLCDMKKRGNLDGLPLSSRTPATSPVTTRTR